MRHLDQRVAAGYVTPAMCRTVAVGAMRAGDTLSADAAVAADNAACRLSGRPRQRDTWAQVIRLQVRGMMDPQGLPCLQHMQVSFGWLFAVPGQAAGPAAGMERCYVQGLAHLTTDLHLCPLCHCGRA